MKLLVIVLCCLSGLGLCAGEEDKLLFKDDFSGPLETWFLDGQGRMSITDDGKLCVFTETPTVAWMKKRFPGDVRIEFDAMTPDEKARAILFFLADGRNGESIFEWERKGDYGEYAFEGRMMLYTIGMLRGFTGKPSNLRKLGGTVKPEWQKLGIRKGDPGFPVPREERRRINKDFQKCTIVTGADDGCKLNTWHHFVCEKRGARITFRVDGAIIHDWTDDGSFGGKPIKRGAIGFRNFARNTRVYYDNVRVSSLGSRGPRP